MKRKARLRIFKRSRVNGRPAMLATLIKDRRISMGGEYDFPAAHARPMEEMWSFDKEYSGSDLVGIRLVFESTS